MKKIFISHAAKDKPLADDFVDLLMTGCEVAEKQIFCSTLEGLGIPVSEGFVEHIKDKITDAPIVIALLSPNYMQSVFCLCELGASWALDKQVIPLAVPPLTRSEINAILTGKQGLNLQDESALDEVHDVVRAALGITGTNTPRWTRKRDQFLEALKGIIPKLPGPQNVSPKKYAECRGKLEDAERELKEKHVAIERLEETIEKLKKVKDAAATRKVILENLPDEKRYDALREQASKFLKKLPQIAGEAIFHHITRRPFLIDPSRTDDAVEAEKKGFIEFDPEASKEAWPKLDDPSVRRAVAAINELRHFLEEEVSKEFGEGFVDEYDYPPDLQNQRFWSDQLGLY